MNSINNLRDLENLIKLMLHLPGPIKSQMNHHIDLKWLDLHLSIIINSHLLLMEDINQVRCLVTMELKVSHRCLHPNSITLNNNRHNISELLVKVSEEILVTMRVKVQEVMFLVLDLMKLLFLNQ